MPFEPVFQFISLLKIEQGNLLHFLDNGLGQGLKVGVVFFKFALETAR